MKHSRQVQQMQQTLQMQLLKASLTFGDPFATFDTWAGYEDARAYADL